jgi:hypothetical protein
MSGIQIFKLAFNWHVIDNAQRVSVRLQHREQRLQPPWLSEQEDDFGLQCFYKPAKLPGCLGEANVAWPIIEMNVTRSGK